ncbi:hypothetical protein LEP1GSC005_1152 [Leptospira santarosai str. ST188]|nr:hypothetical protein LEP1GSC005_1152 [Leptospira santarosai str. ST188]
MRWKIEVFHKILKSGCKAEESKLRTADRLKKNYFQVGNNGCFICFCSV